MDHKKIILLADRFTLAYKKFSGFCDRNNIKIIWILIIFFILFFSLASFWKYYSFQYNALDLGIINQAFYNTSFGRLFEITIHPHSYLGDHFELFILFLMPFYLIFRHPIVLLFLQSIFLGLSAFILYLIAKDKLSKNLSLLMVLAFLVNPFIHNIGLYEFHVLPFAIFFLFLSYLFYEKNKFKWFILFSLIALSVREDVALVIMMFGILALVQKRGLRWILPPLVLGTLWFVIAMKLTGYFSGYGHYKFIKYYGWLGSNYLSIINNFFAHPIAVLKHILTWPNLAFSVGLLLPFAFLPLLRIKYLIPASLVFLQIIFLSTTGELALGIHYTTLLMPFLFVSLVFVFKEIFYGTTGSKILKFLHSEKYIFVIIFLTVTIYCTFVIGPVIPLIKNVLAYNRINQSAELKNDFVNLVPENGVVASGFDFLPNLSSRERVYSLHYLYLGKKQYSEEEYTLPADTEYILLDLNDLIYCQFLYEKTTGGNKRIRDFLIANNFGVSKIVDNQAMLRKNYSTGEKIYELDPKTLPPGYKTVNLDNKITFLGWQNIGTGSEGLKYEVINFQNKKYKILPLSLFWEARQRVEDNLELSISFEKNNKTIYQKIYPLAGGLYPTSEWIEGEKIKTNNWFLIPDYLKNGEYKINIELLKLKASVLLSGVRSMELKIDKIEKIGPKINLGQASL